MEGKGLLYQGSIPSKERINRCHINKNQVYVLPRVEDRGCLSGNQYLVRNGKSVSYIKLGCCLMLHD